MMQLLQGTEAGVRVQEDAAGCTGCVCGSTVLYVEIPSSVFSRYLTSVLLHAFFIIPTFPTTDFNMRKRPHIVCGFIRAQQRNRSSRNVLVQLSHSPL